MCLNSDSSTGLELEVDCSNDMFALKGLSNVGHQSSLARLTIGCLDRYDSWRSKPALCAFDPATDEDCLWTHRSFEDQGWCSQVATGC